MVIRYRGMVEIHENHEHDLGLQCILGSMRWRRCVFGGIVGML